MCVCVLLRKKKQKNPYVYDIAHRRLPSAVRPMSSATNAETRFYFFRKPICLSLHFQKKQLAYFQMTNDAFW